MKEWDARMDSWHMLYRRVCQRLALLGRMAGISCRGDHASVLHCTAGWLAYIAVETGMPVYGTTGQDGWHML